MTPRKKYGCFFCDLYMTFTGFVTQVLTSTRDKNDGLSLDVCTRRDREHTGNAPRRNVLRYLISVMVN